MPLTLTNHTGTVSKPGYAVTLNPNDQSGFVYAVPGSTKVIGIVTESVPYRKPCKIATAGEKANVYCQANIKKDDVVRLSKSTDRVSLGASTVLKANDAPFLRIGVALASGRGLVSCILELAYSQSDVDFNPDDYVPYTGATEDVDLGDYDISAGSGSFGSTADYVDIDANGNMSFVGDATVWEDIRIVPNIFDVPGLTDPDIISYQPAGSGATFKVYAFAKGDEGFFTIQLPHSYKVGSTMYAHVHWTPGPRGVAENTKVVQWRLDYSFAAIDGNFPVSQTLDLSDTCDGTDNKHQMSPTVAISGAGLGISSQMFGRIYRYNHVSDTWAGTGANLPIFIEFDIHFEIDTVGSKTQTAK